MSNFCLKHYKTRYTPVKRDRIKDPRNISIQNEIRTRNEFAQFEATKGHERAHPSIKLTKALIFFSLVFWIFLVLGGCFARIYCKIVGRSRFLAKKTRKPCQKGKDSLFWVSENKDFLAKKTRKNAPPKHPKNKETKNKDFAFLQLNERHHMLRHNMQAQA